MNRSILIVICDFLLVSLLAFSTVDINKSTDEGIPRNIKVEISTNQVESGKDLTAVMRLALDEERRNREQLLGELTKAKEAAEKQQASLGEREKQMQSFQQELQNREAQTAKLQQAQAALEQQFAAAQTNILTLNQQLQNTSTEALVSKEKLAAMQAQLAQLQQSNQLALAEKQRLASELQVSEVERRHAAEQAAAMQEQVKVERAEKARLTQQATQLAEGVKTLANKSGELAQEVRENRPMAPNTIFSEFLTNRVQARFNAVRAGAFGSESTKRKETETVLVSNGTNTFAICHITDTPLTLFNPAIEWEGLTGTLTHSQGTVQIRSLCFAAEDPRLVFMPLTAAEVRELGGKVYRVSSDPFKWQDAVLVGAREGYYGECKFQIDPTTPDYVRLDSSFIRGLFGKFNPSKGDLVFSKTGELLGVMANSTYCLMVRNFTPSASFQFGPDLREQHTGIILSHLYTAVASKPLKLQ